MRSLVALPVILPLLGAGLALTLSRRPRAQQVVSLVVLTAIVLIAAALVYRTDRFGPQTVWVGAWPEPLGVSLVADRLSSLMLLVSAVVTLAVLVYSIGQGMVDDDKDTPVSIYHPTYLVLSAGVANAFLAGDLFNLFVGFEILLFASYVLLTLGGTGPRIRAGTIYVVVNMLASMLFLTSIAAVYAATGTVNLAQLSGRLAELPESVSQVLQLLLLTTFCIKAAVFPLSLWLPDSYPTAPAPVTAVFAGLLTKVGVYAILRMQSLLFPENPLTDLLLWAALLTMIVGVLGAIAQSDIKRMLSFTLVSHIGYMIFGVALATVSGFAGAIVYVVHHITIQTALFLVVGLVERRGGSTSLLKLGGLARLAPLLGLLFFVPAMNLAGIPPMSGFLGKVGLVEAGIEVGTPLAYVLVGASMLTSLLTLYAVAKTWNLAFWRTPEQAHEAALAIEDMGRRTPTSSRRAAVRFHRDHAHSGSTTLTRRDLDEAHRILDDDDSDLDLYQLIERDEVPTKIPKLMVAATAGLITANLAITLAAGPLFAFTERAATDLFDRSVYVTSVLTEGKR